MQLTDKDSFALQCKGGVVLHMDPVNFFELSNDIVTIKKFLISDIKYIVMKHKGVYAGGVVSRHIQHIQVFPPIQPF